MNQAFLDHYRCPESFANFTATGTRSTSSGFFRFGGDVLCYGSSSSHVPAPDLRPHLYDVLGDVAVDRGSVQLPFDPTEVTDNLRRERYLRSSHNGGQRTAPGEALAHFYRVLRPVLPFALRKYLQKLYFRDWERRPFPSWPVDRTVDDLLARLLVLMLKAHVT